MEKIEGLLWRHRRDRISYLKILANSNWKRPFKFEFGTKPPVKQVSFERLSLTRNFILNYIYGNMGSGWFTERCNVFLHYLVNQHASLMGKNYRLSSELSLLSLGLGWNEVFWRFMFKRFVCFFMRRGGKDKAWRIFYNISVGLKNKIKDNSVFFIFLQIFMNLRPLLGARVFKFKNKKKPPIIKRWRQNKHWQALTILKWVYSCLFRKERALQLPFVDLVELLGDAYFRRGSLYNSKLNLYSSIRKWR